MFINTSNLLHEIELAIEMNYDGVAITDLAMALQATSGEIAANPDAQRLATNAARESLSTLSDTQDSIHWNTPQTAAQQYFALENATESQPPPQQIFDGQTPEVILAMEMLLANNGSLFNGAVGGLLGTPEEATRGDRERAEREMKRHAKRKRALLSGVPFVNLNLEADDDDDDERSQDDDEQEQEEGSNFGAYESQLTPNQANVRELLF